MDMNEQTLDVVREVGSIGTAHGATAVSALLDRKVKISLPDVRFLDFNEALEEAGNLEEEILCVLSTLSGEMKGMMLFLMRKDLINQIIGPMLGVEVEEYEDLQDIALSALAEVGNIVISAYINALAGLAQMDIQVTPPAISRDMLGAILSVPMTMLGYETDKIMMVTGNFIIEEKKFDSSFMMVPDIASLQTLTEKLVGRYE
ncbi:chemotaxis protein CheC [Lachnospiraceae bacterium PF1-21]|uniref:Chemotaxis protein CheC n=1 Tax=Ohessyouella blattaphilus TaxID=2949333 RepID=A0ABT1EEL0_9FIRM|nr:chemotaxis protein CheC [Ohessyouella blattaphilus]MCP1109140.1 chemotaxis protein CheC [Ohessyouella blattaphilus]MCR8562534.1 chemotaxis protein CheC [Ohessyouella blattaphilus]MDL2250242.1 chemotaxis protein CheC [Lachnospiraceae bacterium OttesenSCG-928-J05]